MLLPAGRGYNGYDTCHLTDPFQRRGNDGASFLPRNRRAPPMAASVRE